MYKNLFLLAIFGLLLTACDSRQTSQVSCNPEKGMTPYCGFQNPEDLVEVPDGRQLLVSEMGAFMQDTPGFLSLFDLAKKQRLPIAINWKNEKGRWGDASCLAPNPAMFSPHGIDLMQRTDGLHQLLVVNHGGRESIEFFELALTGNSWQLSWRGCATPPEDPFINDVVGLNDGGFFVTHMWNKTLSFEEIADKLVNGVNTGWVWEWNPDAGFSKLAGSDQLMPNGITISKDNRKIFVNIYMGNKTIKIDRESGTVEAEFAVRQPDNISIDKNGILWVASHQHDPINETCNDVKEGPCLLPFVIVRADSNTMKAEVVLSQAGQPMGYATVAIPVGKKLFMGSAHGDRIISAPLPDS